MAHEACVYLRDEIKKFITARDESLRWFSKQCGVDYSTIYRLSAGEQRTIGFSKAHRILSVLKTDNYLEKLSEWFPHETKEILGVGEKIAAERIAIAESLSADYSLFKVFVFAATVPEANRETVLKQFGLEGGVLLETLLEIGALKEENGRYIDCIEGTVYPSEGAAKRIAGYNVTMVSLSSPASLLLNLRASLSTDGLKAWYAAGIEYRLKLQNVAATMKGDILAVASAISGSASLTGAEQ
jgi:hypothetical protein